MSKQKYVIVGGVAGGATAAARIRRNDEHAEIILLEKGRYISYANCGLPYHIGGVIKERDRLFVQTPESFGKRLNIDVRTLSTVTAINVSGKTVHVLQSDGNEYDTPYDKLLLSPGASPVKPPLPGIDSPGIFTLRDVTDTDRIKAFMDSRSIKKAVVVGGGFIGLEMAENLQHAGAEIAIVEMANQVMAPIDYSMAAFVHQHLIDKGVQLYLGQAVASFSTSGDSIVIHLQSGIDITADMVILSIGVRPETQLAHSAGIQTGETRGIQVNEYLQTSVPDIYAIGDAIEFPHPITGKPWLNLLAGPANRQGRIVADNMVFGNTIAYEGAVGTAIAKVFDLTVASTGLPAKRLKQLDLPYLTATIHPSSHASYYPDALPMSIKITFSPEGKLYGAQIVGYDGVDTRINQYALAIKQHATVEQLTRLEHAYAPPFSSAKDPVAISAYVASNILSGKMMPLYWRELQKADLSQICLIDVRTAEEASIGSLPGAVNIPLDDLRDRLSEIPTDKPIYVFCGVGLRGYLASLILKGNGFNNVRNLIGGLKTYHAATASLPVPQGWLSDKTPQEEKTAFPHPVKEEDTIRLDACGLQCPGPIMKLKQKMENMSAGQTIEVSATDAAFPHDAQAWCQSTGNIFLDSESAGGIRKVWIQKGISQPTSSLKDTGNKTFILFSDDLDKALATFVLANGAAATGKKVSIFFTFWGLNAIKKKHKPDVRKDIWGKMFGWMLPSDSRHLSLSKMNIMGIGARMMRHLMKLRGVDSLEDLRQQALQNGVEFIACQMSMDVMGIKREELLDEVTVGGVATYMNRAEQSGVNLFI